MSPVRPYLAFGRRWAWCPVVVLPVLMVILHATVGPAVFYDPEWLILIGNTLFIGVVSFAVAGIAWRNYRATGRIQVLLLGCAMLLFGIGGVVAAVVRGLPGGANLNVTVYNIGALLGALLHFGAALILVAGLTQEATPERRTLWLRAGYVGAALAMAVLTSAALRGVLPVFFIQGSGPTPLRQDVLGSAVLLFVFSCLTFLAIYRRNREPLLFWYAGGLALTATSLFGFFIQHSVGSPVGWAGRLAQYLGGVYFLVALVGAGRHTGASLDEVLASSLTGAEEKFRSAFAHAAVGFTMSTPSGRLVDANPAYCALTGYALEELRALDSMALVHPDDREARLELNRRMLTGGIADSTVDSRRVRKDGRLVWVREAVSLARDARGVPRWVVAIVEDVTERKRAEEALERTKRILAEGQEIAHVGSFDYDARTRAILWSDEQYRIFGRDPAEPAPTYDALFAECIHPDDVALVERTFQAALESGSDLELEHRIVRPDGGVRWVYDRAHPQIDESGQLVRYVGATLDITDRKQAQRLGVLDEVFRTSPSFLHVLRGPECVLEFANEAYYRLVGQRDLIGRPAFEAMPEATGGGYQERVAEVIRTRQAFFGRELPVMLARTPGAPPEERLIDVAYMPLLEPDGTCTRVLGHGADVTEQVRARRRSEEALQESRSRLQAALASMTDAVSISDAAGRFVDFNDAFATYHRFHSKEECCKSRAEYQTLVDVHFPDGTLAPCDMWAGSRALRGETASNAEYILRRKDTGEKWWGSYSFGPIRDNDGHIVGAVVVARDVTERKEREESLRAQAEQQQRSRRAALNLVSDATAARVEAERVAAALRVSEERFRLAARSSRTMVYDLDVRGGRINALQGLPHVLGYDESEAEPTASWWEARIHPDDREAWRSAFAQIQVEPRDVVLQYRVQHKDGRVLHVEDHATPVCDDAGVVERVIGAVTDITQRKLLEAETERLASFPRLNPNPITEVGLDGTVAFMNPAAGRLLRDLPERGTSHPWLADWADIVSACAASNGAAPDRQVLVAGRWYHQTFYYHPEGDTVRVYGMDTTVRRQAEAALEVAQRRLQAVLDAIPVGIIFTDDPSCERITGNPETMAQFEIEADDNISASAADPRAVGRTVRYLQGGRPLTAAELPLQRAVAERRAIPPMEMEVELRSGRRWIAESWARPLLGEGGQVVGGVAVAVDITERKRVEEALAGHARNRAILAATGTRLLEPMPQEDLFRYVGEQLGDLVGRAVVLVSEHRTDGDELVVRSVAGPSDRLAKLAALLGRDLRGLAFTLPKAARERIRGGSLVRLAGGLHDLTYGQMPRSLCRKVEKDLAIGDAHAIPLLIGDELLGTVSLLTERPEGLADPESIEALVNQAALALRRGRVEQALRESETRLRRLNRTLRALGSSSKALLRARDEGDFVDAVCRIVVEECDYEMVWVGYADHDEGKSVRPVASAGFEAGYLEALQVTWADAERGRGPTGTAIRTGQAAKCRDMLTDPSFAPWREEATRRGYAASIALPLMEDSAAFGAITVYSREPDSFTDDEVGLLGELATDLSYGILSLRERAGRRVAEAALRTSELKHSSVLETMETGYWLYDREGQLLEVNDAYCRMSGYTRDELLRLRISDLELHETPPEVQRHIADICARKHDAFETHHRRKDGTNFDVEIRATYLDIEGGRLTSMILDISDRKRMERELWESRERFRVLSEAMPQIVWSADAAGRMDYYNRRAYDYGGLKHSDVDGWSWAAVIHPDDMEPTLKAWEHSLGTGRPYGIEQRLRRADGEYRWHLTRALALRDERGHVARWIGTATDIHDQKRAEEKLRESESRFRSAFDEGAVAMALTSLDGQVMRANGAFCRLMRWKEHELVGRGIDELIHPDDVAASRAALDSVVKGGKLSFRFEKRCLGKNERLIWADISAAPVLDVNGRPRYLVMHLQDVTERRRAELALEKSAARFQLLSEVSARLLAAEDPQTIVDELCAKVMKYLGCDLFFNFLLDKPSRRLRLNACGGVPEVEARKLAWLDGDGTTVCGCVARDGQRLVAEHIPDTRDARTALVASLGAKAYACHPLTGAEGTVLGTLSFGTRSRETFTESDLELMRFVADQVAIAVMRLQAQAEVARLNTDLQRRVAELQAFLDTVPIGLAIGEDPEGRHIRGNPAMERLLGVPSGGELSKLAPGAAYRVFADGRELPADELPVQRAARGEPVVGQRIEIERPDGDRVKAISFAAPLPDEAGRPRGAVAAFLDVTALQEAEEARRLSEERYRRLFASMSEGFSLHELVVDEEGRPSDYRYLEVNPAFERLTGLKAADVLGRTELDVLPRTEPIWFERYGRVALTGQAESFEEFHGQLGRWFHVHAFQTGPGQFASVLADVTERRQAEEAVARAKEEWERTFDTVPDLIAILDKDHRIVRANRAMASRLASDQVECVGALCHDVVHGTARPPANCPHARTLRDGEEHTVELHEANLGGDFLVSTTPLHDAQGKLVGTVHVARDITERKRLEERLRAGEERLALATEEAGMATWDVDLTTGVAVWSRRYFDLLGYPPAPGGEAGLDMWRQCLHPADIERVLADFERARRERGPFTPTYRVIRRDDGQVRWLRSFGRFMYDNRGIARRFVGISFDDTALQEAARFIEATSRAARAAPPVPGQVPGQTARRSGIAPVGDVPWGTHFCQFYETAGDLADVLVPFFREGLAAGEFCLWVTAEPLGVEQATAALRAAVPDLDERLASCQIEIVDYRGWYLSSGRFDADSVAEACTRKLERALQRGYTGLRVSGNTSWLGRDDWDEYCAFEEITNGAIGRCRMLALCAYPLSACGIGEIVDIITSHQFALIKRAGKWDIVVSAEHKMVESALRQSEERLRLATWSAELGVFELDMVGENAVWENQRMFEIFGQSDQDGALNTAQLTELAIVPEDVVTFKTALALGRLPGRLFQTVCRIRRRNDRALRWVEFSGRFERDEDAQPVRLLGVVADVTERVQAEEDLRRREQEYRELMENASDGVVLADADGHLVAANARACELLGYRDARDLCHVPLEDLLPPRDLPRLQVGTASLAQGSSAMFEHRARRHDGSWVHLETNVRRLADGRYQAILRDVSDRKRAEEEFRRAVANQAYDRLFAMLREFQHGEGLAMNLHRIALFAKNVDLLREEPPEPGAPAEAAAAEHEAATSARTRLEVAAREYRTVGCQTLLSLAALLRSVEHEFSEVGPREERVTGAEIKALAEALNVGVEELMRVIERNGPPGALPPAGAVGDRLAEQVDVLQRKLAALTRGLRSRYTAKLPEVVETIARSFQTAAPGMSITVEVEHPGLQGLISPVDLSELLRLLISNSLDALAGVGSDAEPAGEKAVRLRIREDESGAVIEVEDTGPGVPAKLRDRLFKKGFSTKGEGRGNGLTFALDHLAKYGGGLSYDATYTAGARFRIKLVLV